MCYKEILVELLFSCQYIYRKLDLEWILYLKSICFVRDEFLASLGIRRMRSTILRHARRQNLNFWFAWQYWSNLRLDLRTTFCVHMLLEWIYTNTDVESCWKEILVGLLFACQYIYRNISWPWVNFVFEIYLLCSWWILGKFGHKRVRSTILRHAGR